MRRVKKHGLGLAVWALLVGSCPSDIHALGSTNVPVQERVYRDLDKLISFGLIPDAIYGQRPWSRNEIARMIEGAMDRRPSIVDAGLGSVVDRVLDRLKDEFREEIRLRDAAGKGAGEIVFHPLSRATVDLMYLEDSARDIRPRNGVGAVDGYVQPLVAFHEGLKFVDGSHLSLETDHRAYLTKYFALAARPHWRFLFSDGGEASAEFAAQDLYGKFQVANLELEVGRDHLIWGQSAWGGLLFSNNARSLDMVKISNDSPFLHPWIFKYLGPSKYTLFVSNLGPDRVFKNSYLYGIKASFKPFSVVELGFSETVIMGGEGAPDVSLWDPISELFPFHKIGRNAAFADISDHRFGIIDLRVDVPYLRHSVLYFDQFFDDSPWRAFGHLTSDYWDEVALVLGAYVPRLNRDGTLDLRIEYRHLPPWAYRHGQWITGYTLNRALIGDPLGPDADGVFLTSSYELGPTLLLSATLAYESRGGDLFSQTKETDPRGGDEVIRSEHHPTEHRIRFLSSLSWDTNPWCRLRFDFGYEHVKNFEFVAENLRESFLGAVQLQFLPEKIF